MDAGSTLALLQRSGLLPAMAPGQLRRRQETIRNNRAHDYSRLHRDPEAQGKVLYIQHELMVSRFHAMLELACQKSAGKIVLEQWKQGPELWNRIQVPKCRQEDGQLVELPETEILPHRPDAFFTLYFPGRPAGKQRAHFFYEADRGSENTTRFRLKLRVHFHYTVKQQRQRIDACYGVYGIRAVLTESTDMQWAHNLRLAARDPIVSPKPSPLFWFTTSALLTKPVAAGKRQLPRYLVEPEAVLEPIWANPVENKFWGLAD